MACDSHCHGSPRLDCGSPPHRAAISALLEAAHPRAAEAEGLAQKA